MDDRNQRIIIRKDSGAVGIHVDRERLRHAGRSNVAWGDGHVSSEGVGTINISHDCAVTARVGFVGGATQDLYNPTRTSDECADE